MISLSILEQILSAEQQLSQAIAQAQVEKQQLIEKTRIDTTKEVETLYREANDSAVKLQQETEAILKQEQLHFEAAMRLIESDVKEKTQSKLNKVVNLILSEVNKI